MGKLTLKQQRFADEYIISGNATDAALKAGYSKKASYSIGSENMKKPVIKSYIDQRLAEIKSAKIADQTEIMEYLTSLMRGEQTEKTLIGLGEGAQKITDIDVGAGQRIKAAELIGKRYGMWTEKVDVSATSVIIVDDIDDE